MNKNTAKILSLANGVRTSSEIARKVGLTPRYVRKVLLKHDAPRPNQGAQSGQRNHQWVCGRRIDMDGYVLVTVPYDHPYARQRSNRRQKIIFEHRLVMEYKLGRYLEPQEVVDHIDGLTLHNHPSNLRLFENNAAHLKATLAGKRPKISRLGMRNVGIRPDCGQDYQPVCTYSQNKKSGDVRLRQILLAWLSLDKDSPYLLGTHHLLERIGIDPYKRSSLERAWGDLSRRLEANLSQ